MVEVKQLVSSEPLQVSMQICSQARGKLGNLIGSGLSDRKSAIFEGFQA